MTTNQTPRNDLRDFLIRQALGTLKTKFGIVAEPGWFPDEWNANTVQRIVVALGGAPTPGVSEPVIFENDEITLTGFLGHLTVAVGSTIVYFHNRS